jgi:hypothetical protein
MSTLEKDRRVIKATVRPEVIAFELDDGSEVTAPLSAFPILSAGTDAARSECLEIHPPVAVIAQGRDRLAIPPRAS